jgi:hypothetical protein
VNGTPTTGGGMEATCRSACRISVTKQRKEQPNVESTGWCQATNSELEFSYRMRAVLVSSGDVWPRLVRATSTAATRRSGEIPRAVTPFRASDKSIHRV